MLFRLDVGSTVIGSVRRFFLYTLRLIVDFCCVFLMSLLGFACFLFFFFSSRRRHTRLVSDWSSDVCSSDLAAVREALEHGTTYFLVNEPIVKLADELCRAVRCAEQVRFTSTGTEATFFALRVARAYRKRDKIMKFEGGYHGGHDYALMSAAPRSPKAFPAATPDSAGIPHVLEGEVLIAPYNDLATVEALLAVYADELAAVIVEPFQRLIPPPPGFLEGLRALTRRHGIPLIFDEVVTGFRFAYGGAQEYYDRVPDLPAP